MPFVVDTARGPYRRHRPIFARLRHATLRRYAMPGPPPRHYSWSTYMLFDTPLLLIPASFASRYHTAITMPRRFPDAAFVSLRRRRLRRRRRRFTRCHAAGFRCRALHCFRRAFTLMLSLYDFRRCCAYFRAQNIMMVLDIRCAAADYDTLAAADADICRRSRQLSRRLCAGTFQRR